MRLGDLRRDVKAEPQALLTRAIATRVGVAVLFTDIQMPGSMDGLRLAADVKDRWPPIALLITSGKLRPPTADIPAGARFIPKPYSPLQLKDQLHSLTSGRGQ
jgi:two-component system, response regulator PdtaR